MNRAHRCVAAGGILVWPHGALFSPGALGRSPEEVMLRIAGTVPEFHSATPDGRRRRRAGSRF